RDLVGAAADDRLALLVDEAPADVHGRVQRDRAEIRLEPGLEFEASVHLRPPRAAQHEHAAAGKERIEPQPARLVGNDRVDTRTASGPEERGGDALDRI